MSFLTQDISFSFRLLRRHPVESALAVAALSIGVGLSTAMFSILWGTVLRGLPYQGADRLVRIETVSQGEKLTPTDADYLAWRRRQGSFEGMAAFLGSSFNLSGVGVVAERCNGAYVSANMFQLVGVHPLLGRDFGEDEEVWHAPQVAILGAELWKSHFKGDPNVLGKPIKLNGIPTQVVGVMPEGFGFPLHQEVWVALQLDPQPKQPLRIQVIGKLKRGVSRRQSAADLEVATAPRSHGSSRPGVLVTPYIKAYTEDLQPALHLLLGASLGLLLVVCANVAGLLTARTVTRLPELAVRSAAGATRSRLLVQLMAETAVLAAAGATLSLPLAAAANHAYVASQGGELRSFWMDVRLDAPSIAYALAITILVSFLAALIPSLQVTGPRLNEALKRGAGKGAVNPPGTSSSIRLMFQFALSFALLVGTGLIIESLRHMSNLNFGATPEGVLTAQLLVPYARYSTPMEQAQFFDALQHRLEVTTGPGRVAFASTLPGGQAGHAGVEIEGQPPLASDHSEVPYLIVSRDYFQVLRVDALQGRLLDASDRAAGQPVAMVNQSFVRRYFGSRPPVGARLRLVPSTGPGRWRTVVGVVPDLVTGGDPVLHPEGVYLPLEQVPQGWMAMLLRTPVKPLSFAKVLRRTVAEIDPEIPVFWISTLEERRANARLPLQTVGEVFLAFSTVALFLSLLGVYGVTAQSVASRSREMAIRLTLGSQKSDLLRLLLRKALLPVVVGIGLGLLLSLGSSRLLASLLFEVRAWEPGVFGLVGFLLILAGLLACLFPASKVLRVQVAEVLRGD